MFYTDKEAAEHIPNNEFKFKRVSSEAIPAKKSGVEARLIERAKEVLMEYLKMTEAQAHRYIEKQAMDMRITRREVAESILKTYENQI